jgi:hypothetical protein
MYRVHVVDRPLSTYLRLEFLGYQENAAAGEEVYIADRGAHPDLRGLTEDFWLFDDEVAVRMIYDAEGRFVGVERALDAELQHYRHRRDLALAHSVPLADYLDAEGQRRA